MTYRQKLRDPRWQKVRLTVFERDEWRCQRPDCHSPEHTPLAVHHKNYISGRDPWDYPLTDLITFCEPCHDREHALSTAEPMVEGRVYAWDDLKRVLGFTPDKYLTEKDGAIVCVCVRKDYNPDAPGILLAGDTPEIVDKSQKFTGQENFIPVFLKAMDAGWKYCGRHRVESATSNAAEIAIQQRHANLHGIPIAMVLFLEKESIVNSENPHKNSTK